MVWPLRNDTIEGFSGGEGTIDCGHLYVLQLLTEKKA